MLSLRLHKTDRRRGAPRAGAAGRRRDDAIRAEVEASSSRARTSRTSAGAARRAPGADGAVTAAERAAVLESRHKPPSYQLQFRKCGKAKCAKWHGPYWFAYWKEGGRVRSRYIGSDDRLAELLAGQGDPSFARARVAAMRGKLHPMFPPLESPKKRRR